jgi:SAM-dependent methyltransferase
MTVFDSAANQFTEGTDRAIAAGDYLRGRLVLQMTSAAARAGGLVLDYGCGPGRLAWVLAKEGFRVRGVDTSRGMIERALQLDCSGLDLQFALVQGVADIDEPNAYDAVLCSSVIEYVPNPDEVLDVFSRVLRRPGALIISYANKSSLWRRRWEQQAKANPMFTPHNRTWNWTEFRDLLTRHGFRPVCAPRFFESPCDAYRFGRVFRRLPLAGSLGIVAAEPTGALGQG